MGKYFGTDGFRGTYGKELCDNHAYKIGRFLGAYKNETPARVIIGKDTRESGDNLEKALIDGLVFAGANCYLLGITTTPCVAYAVRNGDFDFGIMISASHNPYYDNGIKIINGQGEKIDEPLIYKIEEFLDQEIMPADKKEGRVLEYKIGIENYKKYLINASNRNFSGLRVGIDTSNGSAYKIAGEVFKALGAEVYMINNTPNGKNINLSCGSTNIGALCSFVKEKGLDLGFAFDGDADRCIGVDSQGNEVDGDKIMYILACNLKARGELRGNLVVTTVMSNMGLYEALSKIGVGYTQTRVGDYYVSEEIKRGDFSLGGEQSGHIILSKYAPSGDGILTALKVTEAILDSGKGLDELSGEIVPYFQETRSAPTNDKEKTMSSAKVKAAIEKAQIELEGDGRILVRPSGTEPTIRIMVESKSREKGQKILSYIYNIVESEA